MGGAGGSAPLPRSLPIAYVSSATPDPDTLMVVINSADGSLVESFLGSELPTEATVIDGDTVTYLYLSSSSNTDGQFQRIDAYRVTPELERLEIGAPLYFEPSGGLDCLYETMHVTVHVPAVPDGLNARVWFANARASCGDVVPSPGTIEYDLPSCSLPGATMPVLVTVSGPDGGYVAFEMIEDVPFEVGATVELTPTFTSAPRTTLAFEVDDVGDAESADGWAAWYGWFDFYAEPLYFLFTPNEPAMAASFEVDGPFTYSASPMDLPHGYVVGFTRLQFPPDEAACRRGAGVGRMGESAGAVRFAATELAEPIEDGATWRLGSGATGDWLERQSFNGTTFWVSHEDPTRAPLPIVFPDLPETLPLGFTLPEGEFTLRSHVHHEDDAVPSYAAAFASHRSELAPSTRRSRSRTLVCE